MKGTNIMITLSRNEVKQLQELSDWFGCSKSRVIAMGLKELNVIADSVRLRPTYLKKIKNTVLNEGDLES